jgi:GTP-binding protein Era
MADPGERRCGFVAVAGAPNAGKSTLVNRLVGAKVSIVSPKVQTTRQRLVGIAMAGDSQILLVDTPGVFVGAKRRLEKAMVAGAWAGVADADLVLLVVDAGRGGRAAAEPLIERLAAGPAPPVLLALNKIDLVPRPSLLDLARDLNERLGCVATFMISATKGDGVDDLKRDLARRVPAGPWHYPDDQAADLPLRRLAAELTREQLFLKLHDELPYAVAVDTEQWQERGRPDDPRDRQRRASGDRGRYRPAGASVPACRGARGLG